MKKKAGTHFHIFDDDFTAGYFVFETSSIAHFRRLCESIGGENKLISIHVRKRSDGSLIRLIAKVPKRFLTRNNSRGTASVKSVKTLQNTLRLFSKVVRNKLRER